MRGMWRLCGDEWLFSFADCVSASKELVGASWPANTPLIDFAFATKAAPAQPNCLSFLKQKHNQVPLYEYCQQSIDNKRLRIDT